MTWVVGLPTFFGNCVALSDIQATITYANGKKEYHDCVRKVHAVGHCIAAGFSGSIKIGFDLIDDLQRMMSVTAPEVKWPTDFAARSWRTSAQKIFAAQPSPSPTSILLLGTLPKFEPGIDKTYGCIMNSPDFLIEQIPSGKVAGIGSGNDVKEYKNLLEEMNRELYNPLMQLEVGNPGGFGKGIAFTITRKVESNRVDGISPHFHQCTVFPHNIKIEPNDYTFTPSDGGPIREFVMPKTAANWEEFETIMKNKGIHSIAYAIA